jgi:hypothetical protein
VTILDRPATVSAPVTVVEYCQCVENPGSACMVWSASGNGIRVPVQLGDPDGDPSLITALPSGSLPIQPAPTICSGSWCYPMVNVYGTSAAGVVTARAGTGITTSTTFSVSATCFSANLPCTCPP